MSATQSRCTGTSSSTARCCTCPPSASSVGRSPRSRARRHTHLGYLTCSREVEERERTHRATPEGCAPAARQTLDEFDFSRPKFGRRTRELADGVLTHRAVVLIGDCGPARPLYGPGVAALQKRRVRFTTPPRGQ